MPSNRLNLNKIYRALLHLDKKLLVDCWNNDLDDKTFFLHGLQEDIVSNALGLIVPYHAGDSDLAGPASNCRSILEAFAFMSKLDNDELSPQQLKRYRDSYRIIEFDNAKEFWEINPTDEMKEFIDKEKDNVDRIIESYAAELNCEKRKIRKLSKSPLFVLAGEDLNEQTPIKYFHLIKDFSAKQGPFVIELYNKLGSMLHPQFVSDVEIRDFEKGLVLWCIDGTLKIVRDYLFDELKISNNDCSKQKGLLVDFKDDSFSRQFNYLDEKIKHLVSFVSVATANKTGQRNSFIRDFWVRAINLYADIESCGILGYREQATMKFKSLIELVAFFFLTLYEDSEEEVNARIECYDVSSQMSVYKGRKDDKSLNIMRDLEERLKSVFESFYKKAYNLDSFDVFKDQIINNNHYFLSKKETIKDLVFRFIENNQNGDDSDWKKWARYAYKTSLDMEHSGGYALLSREDQWKNIFQSESDWISRFFMMEMNFIIRDEQDDLIKQKLLIYAQGYTELAVRESLARLKFGTVNR